ncbi:MAG: S8 family serine peptidase, partial [Verrucomicrobia subdivision 3 bacterium]|nr:S8 family serine peptidase [Limisphaerales bacterium]
GQIDPTTILVKARGLEDDFHRKMGAGHKKLKHVKWSIVKLKKPEDIRDYEESGLFDWVSPNRIYNVVTTPDDPLFAQQWCHQVMQSQSAWDIATGSDVVVAVIDTGINYTHPDLIDNLWTGPGGEHGYTAIGGTLRIGGQDDHFHGSHVAGIIGAVGNNNLGVVGVNWRIKLLSMKFLTAQGSGSGADAILLIEKLIELKQQGVNIRISNNSWGGGGYDFALEDAFREAENAGILNICAAGNDATDTDDFPFSPSSLDVEGIVSVLASDSGDNRAYFSNYGVESTDIFSPGVRIVSTALGTNYVLASGTSMASPQVAGAAAMLFALNPALTPGQAKQILLDPGSYDRIDHPLNSTGGGRVNVHKLWNSPLIQNPPPPNHPPAITLLPDTNRVFVAVGETVPLAIFANDPDGDAIFYRTSWDTHKYPWFLRYMMGGVQPGAVTNFSGDTLTNILFVTGKNLAQDQNTKIRLTAADGRGAGASRRISAWTPRNEALVNDLQATILGFWVWKDATNWPWFRLDVDPDYPAISTVRFHLKAYGGAVSGGGFGVTCCFEPNVDHRAHWNGFIEGSESVRPIVMDGLGNFATGPSSVLFVGNATLRPPVVRAVYNTQRGPAPLQVTADLRGTSPGDATRLFYTVLLLDEGGVTLDIFNPLRQFTLSEPGVYAVEFTATDYYQPISDRIVDIFTVLPPADTANQPSPSPPPSPILTPPQDLSVTLLENGLLHLRWTDTATGEDRWMVEIASKAKGPWRPWRPLATLPADSHSYTFDRIRGDHRFRITAGKNSRRGLYSNVASIRIR